MVGNDLAGPWTGIGETLKLAGGANGEVFKVAKIETDDLDGESDCKREELGPDEDGPGLN